MIYAICSVALALITVAYVWWVNKYHLRTKIKRAEYVKDSIMEDGSFAIDILEVEFQDGKIEKFHKGSGGWYHFPTLKIASNQSRIYQYHHYARRT
jgi:hypothetical protein